MDGGEIKKPDTYQGNYSFKLIKLEFKVSIKGLNLTTASEDAVSVLLGDPDESSSPVPTTTVSRSKKPTLLNAGGACLVPVVDFEGVDVASWSLDNWTLVPTSPVCPSKLMAPKAVTCKEEVQDDIREVQDVQEVHKLKLTLSFSQVEVQGA